jgi:CubicO group peptidase (beta-lactamase class C family)
MYCAAQRIMAEPTLARRLPYEDMRQDVARASEDLLTQLQQLATAETRPSVMAFTRAFRAFLDLNATIASDALLAETPADMDTVRALAVAKGDAAYAQAHAALQTLVARLGTPVSPGAVGAAMAAPDYWPTAGWRPATPAQQGMDTARLADMLERIQQEAHAIDSLTIVRHGYLVLDAYQYPFQKGMTHYMHSCTKSIISALIGIALDRGDLTTVRQPLLELFPAYPMANADARKRAITLEHLLTMTTGLQCRDSEKYKWAGAWEMMRSHDWASFVLDLPMAEAPGARFEYCSGASYLLSVILQQATQMRALEYAQTYLFAPLGITEVRWRTSPQGVNIGWGEMWLTPHDMAKIGWLYLNHGRWDTRQIVSANWVTASTHGQTDATPFPRYGYQWWSATASSWRQDLQSTVDVDYAFAAGFQGQYIFVVPSQHLVVVFTGKLEGETSFLPQKFLHDTILPAITSPEPLPANPQQQARLETLVAQLARAPAAGYTWGMAAEGTAQEGTFVRTATPALRFDYPQGSRRLDLKDPNQIMRMTTLEGVSFSASIGEIPADIPLADMGSKFYAPLLKKVGSEVTVVTNRAITLRDGSPAYRTDIRWTAPPIAVPMTSIFVTAYREGKRVVVAVHPCCWQDVLTYAPIAESLTFQ